MFIHYTEIDGTMNKNKYVPAELYSLAKQVQLNNMIKIQVSLKNYKQPFLCVETVKKIRELRYYVFMCMWIIWYIFNEIRCRQPWKPLGVQTGACQVENSR